MSDYYTSWRRKGPGIIQRTYSYRNRAPRGSVANTQLALSREETLESNGSSPLAKGQLYSDLYAEAGNSETYNSEDSGHEFLSQTWKCSRLGSVDARYVHIPNVPHTRSERVSDRTWVCLRPGAATLAAWGLKDHMCDPTYSYNYDVKPYALGSRIQDILWAQCPDSISGSLGQDAVDVLALGRQLDKLLSLQAKGVSLSKQFLHFSAKKRDQIDKSFALWRDSPGKGIDSLASHLGGEYLTWLFQYLPWVEDLQTLLGAATSTYLRARGRTRKRTIKNLRKTVDDYLKAGRIRNWEVQYFHPQFDRALSIQPSADDLQQKGYWKIVANSNIPVNDVAYRLTASVVSVWTQNFEHGAVEPLYELNKKLGLVYPSLIWDLIPWSWLVDWFVNVGKFIDRAWNRAYGEWNCSYAYVTTKWVATFGGMSYLQTCRCRVSPTMKGWGFKRGCDLSSSQWGILTALGLSHRN